MDLRALRYFVAVKETGSISGASKVCFVAQPSISSSLQQLEQSIGTQLFLRHTRGVTPTEAAEKLYPQAKQLLAQANAMKEMFSLETDKIRYRLGLVRGLGVARMSDILQKFTAANPNIELVLVPPEETCDARIISKRLANQNERFISMWHEEFSVAIPPAHPLTLRRTLTRQDLHNVAFIQRTPCEAWEQLQHALVVDGIKLDIRANIQTIEYAVGLVNAGVGCALLPDYIESVRQYNLIRRHIADMPLSRHVGLAYEQQSAITESLKHLVTGDFAT
ncbi:MAG: LysR family transcriptional regulator [Aestuariibacter sp.]